LRALHQIDTNEFSPSSKKILIIDDEPYNCMALYVLIKGLKIPPSQIDFATSGKAALCKLL